MSKIVLSKRPLVALLPMKANSTRVPGKNFREFLGKPLFRWILDTLLALDDIDHVIINTDAREVLARNGLLESDRITIRDRKSDLCGDHISMNLVIRDDLEYSNSHYFLMTHTTNPLLSKDAIKRAIDMFFEGYSNRQLDSLFSVKKHQSRFYRVDGSPLNHDPSILIPTQDLEPMFEENSNLYLFSKESFALTQARIGQRPAMFELSSLESVDIDTQDDWEFATVAGQYRRAGAES